MNTLPTPQDPHRHAMVLPTMPIQTDTGMMQIEKPATVPRPEFERVEAQRDKLWMALTHALKRMRDFEDYVKGDRKSPPSASAAIMFAEQAIKEIGGEKS